MRSPMLLQSANYLRSLVSPLDQLGFHIVRDIVQKTGNNLSIYFMYF